jgi:drug/metabolite transporter (DMT)-like permease
MSAILGGLVAAFGWGTATLVSSRTTRMIGSQQALAWVMVTGLVITGISAPVVEGMPSPGTGGALWAIASGLCSVLGLSMMYRALRIGKVGVVAPIGATEGAFAAVIAVVVLNEQLTRGVAVALLVVTAGIVLVTFHGRLSDIHVRPSAYALVAATIFGFGLVASARAGQAVGPLWTILVARLVGCLLIALPLLLRGRLRVPPRRPLLMAIYSGVGEVVGFVGYIAGSRSSIAVCAVIASQYAVVAAVGSYLAFGERLNRLQLTGGIVLMAGIAAVAAIHA